MFSTICFHSAATTSTDMNRKTGRQCYLRIKDNNSRILVQEIYINSCALNNTSRIVQHTELGCQAVSVNFGGVLKHLVVFPISSLVEYFAGVLLVVDVLKHC